MYDARTTVKLEFIQISRESSQMLFHLYRPDRMCYAVTSFIEEKLGPKYVENRTIEFAKSYEEASPSTPIFFILSPGVNPLKDVEALGHVLGYTADNGNFHNVSLGRQFVTCLKHYEN